MKIEVESRTDQINADDLVGRSETYTIAGIRPGVATTKYDIDLVETPGRCWRPPITMQKLLVIAWGDEAADWIGRRVTLYTDPTVSFGKDKVGGIRISHLSHITEPVQANLLVTRGKRKLLTVQPLIEQAPTVPDDIAQAASKAHSEGNLEAYRDWLQEKGAPAHIMQYINELENK